LPVGLNACPVYVTITATNEAGQSQVTTLGGETTLDGTGNSVWMLDQSVSLLDGSIDSLKLTVNGDPEVGIEFGFRAGSSATTFDIKSTDEEVVEFSPMVDPIGHASAGITLTDRNNNGAVITGLFAGGSTHQARYNGSTVFANLVSGFSIGSGTLTASEDQPLSGGQIISDTLTSIESEFYFKLSARDSASGTSTFEVTPEPATICLLGLGLTALISRRKRS
jgi:hypothetical protein